MEFLLVSLLGIVGIGILILFLKFNFQALTQQLQLSLLKQISEGQIRSLNLLQDTLQKGREETRFALKDISGQVEKRLSEGFEKSTQTFTDIVKRLALIDEAQKKITELSGNVLSLKDLLADKRSRGAFGEVQLETLVRNLLPETHFHLQHTLSNGMRADCMLILPPPTGNIVIDAKFPLENYQKSMDRDLSEADRKIIEALFRRDIKTHIQAISSKYILKNETGEGAIMFIPAEAIFAEIHAHYPDLVQAAQQAKVWIASPTTMMAILTTVKAVIKDDATRKQVHIIQEHLGVLAKDFERFDQRMDDLTRHIAKAHDDVKNVNISAKKISARFTKIEQVEMEEPVLLE